MEWISINDRLPTFENQDEIFLVRNNYEKSFARWKWEMEDKNSGADWDEYEFEPKPFIPNISHWMTIPEFPEEFKKLL